MPLYHEQQSLALCAVHAVNNLLQRQEYTKKDFDAVCQALSEATWFNPHRSMLNIGDYDVNVVSIVLERQNLQVTWWDQRQELHASDLERCLGVLWNVASPSLLGWMLRGRHWIALRYDNNDENNKWINLDSMRIKPGAIGSHDKCAKLLNTLRHDSHILLIKETETEQQCKQHSAVSAS
jgi:josephin